MFMYYSSTAGASLPFYCLDIWSGPGIPEMKYRKQQRRSPSMPSGIYIFFFNVKGSESNRTSGSFFAEKLS